MLDMTEVYWTAAEAITWIIWRDEWKVQKLSRNERYNYVITIIKASMPPSEWKINAPSFAGRAAQIAAAGSSDRKPDDVVRNVVRDLEDAARNGIKTVARSLVEPRSEPLNPCDWNDLRITGDTHNQRDELLSIKNNKTVWLEPQFCRSDVMGKWPPSPRTKDAPHSDEGATVAKEVSRVSTLGRPKGSGSLDAKDEPLLKEMECMIAQEPTLSPFAAAGKLADKAAGGGTPESKMKRLQKKYTQRNSAE